MGEAKLKIVAAEPGDSRHRSRSSVQDSCGFFLVGGDG